MTALVLVLLLNSAALGKELDAESAKFLDECRYILTKLETQMFDTLPDAEARRAFIDKFWRGWDPNPLTAANEYRDLYYERLEEANRLFTRGMPGYLTDRGKVYILMGPPDEKEPYYAGRGSDEKPSEIWTYRSAKHLGLDRDTEITFIDETGTGNYRISSRTDLEAGAARAGIFRSLQGDIAASRAATKLQTNPREVQGLSDVSIAQAPATAAPDAVAAATTEFKIPVAHRIDFFKAEMQKTLLVFTVSLDRAVATGTLADYKVYCRIENPDAPAAAAAPAETPATPAAEGAPPAAPGPIVVETMEGKETKKHLLYQAQIPVDPGSYRIIYGVTDVALSLPKTFEAKAEVPAYADDAFALSSIIPATLIEKAPEAPAPTPAADGSIPMEELGPKLTPFVLSGMTVLPSVDGTFEKGDTLFVYNQAYGAKTDPAKGKPRIDVKYLIFMKQADGKSWKPVGQMPNPGQTEMVLEYELELKLLPGKGDYKVEVTVTDTLGATAKKGEALFSIK